jgi:hypothetical protein
MTDFDLDTARDASLWTVTAAVLLALVAVWVVKHVVSKVLTVVILLAIAALVWSQRAELVDCADQVTATIDQGLVPDTTCTFFGRDVTVPGSATLLGPDETGQLRTTKSSSTQPVVPSTSVTGR